MCVYIYVCVYIYIYIYNKNVRVGEMTPQLIMPDALTENLYPSTHIWWLRNPASDMLWALWWLAHLTAYTHKDTQAHKYTHMYTHAYIHIYTHTHKYTHMYTHIYTYTHTYTYTHIHIQSHMLIFQQLNHHIDKYGLFCSFSSDSP